MNGEFSLGSKTILEMIARSVSRYPNALAIEQHVHGVQKCTTYEELLEDAEKIAADVSQHCQESRIGLVARRSREFIVGMLGIMMAKKAFVPIDPAWPEDRIRTLEKQLGIHTILDEAAISSITSGKWSPFLDRIDVEPKDSAYFICSSGSTGAPKCIDITHAGIPNLAANQVDLFKSKLGSRFLWMLSPMFDGSLSDIFVALSSGATILIHDGFCQQMSFAETWTTAKWLNATHIDIPPVLLRSILDPTDMPECIETLIVGGESLSREVVQKYAPRCRLVNVYGPTEATICTSGKVYTIENADDEEITVGKPFSGLRYKLSNNESGIAELLVSGKQLARGYVGDSSRIEDLNRDKFIKDENGTRWFKTGDLAERTPAGEWKILGRIDRQLKINGKLVAPEEIEAVASAIGLTAAVVCHAGKLECIVEGHEDKTTVKNLERLFREKLPNWMVPRIAKFLDRLPRLASGKISYSEILKILEVEHREKEVEDSCKDEVLHEVQLMVSTVLRTTSLPRKTASLKNDFGADSIQYIMLAVKLKSKWNIQLNACDFKENDTPEKIAKLVKAKLFGKDVCDAVDLEEKAREIENSIIDLGKNEEKNLVLVTGGAGFLGSHVIKEILRTTNQTIACIVKCSDYWSAVSKIENALERAGAAKDMRRISCFAGDLAKRNFGLSEKGYEDLCRRVSIVFHIAGEVNDWKDTDDLSSSNVEATKNVIKFCTVDGDAKLAFASTLSVFVSRSDLPPGYICREEILKSEGKIVGGYAQSKWIAEKIVSDLVPASKLKIFRYGLLTEPLGYPMKFKRNTLSMFLRGAKKLGILPLSQKELKVDLTPIDIAARATVAGALLRPLKRTIIHVHAGMQTRYLDILNKLQRSGIIRTCSYDCWKLEVVKTHLESGCDDEDMIVCFEALSRNDGFKFGPFDLFQSTDIFFERLGMTSNYLKEDADIENLAHAKYLDQLLRCNSSEKDW